MKYGMGLVIMLLLISCNKPVKHRSYEIIKVELSRSGAWADFGATLSVDTALNYKYYGDYGNRKQSYFTGKVSNNFWDTLNQKLQYIRYKALPTTGDTNIQDANYFELIVHWKKGEQHVVKVWEYPTDSVLSIIKWIDTSYRRVKLSQVNDTLQFESRYHHNLKPPISRVYFPSPEPKTKKKHAFK